MSEGGGNGGSASLGFCTILGLIFITLKLTDQIAWDWLWVLSPIWIPWGLVVGVLFAMVPFSVWMGISGRRARNKRIAELAKRYGGGQT